MRIFKDPHGFQWCKELATFPPCWQCWQCYTMLTRCWIVTKATDGAMQGVPCRDAGDARGMLQGTSKAPLRIRSANLAKPVLGQGSQVCVKGHSVSVHVLCLNSTWFYLNVSMSQCHSMWFNVSKVAKGSLRGWLRHPFLLRQHWVPIALWDFLQGWTATTSPSCKGWRMMAANNDWYGWLTMTEVFVVQVWIKSKVSVHSRKILELGVHSPFTPFAAKIPVPVVWEEGVYVLQFCNRAPSCHTFWANWKPFQSVPEIPSEETRDPVKVCECIDSLI